MSEDNFQDVDQTVEIDTSQEIEVVESPEDNPYYQLKEHYEQEGFLSSDELDIVADLAVKYIRELLSFFGETHISIDEYEGDSGELILDISEGNLAVLIGRHGRTLDSLQMIVSSFLSNTLKFHFPVVIDIEGYKSRRKEKVRSMALSAAARAKRTHGRVTMAPMSAYERRLIHVTLLNEENIKTHSEGEEPERRVVVTYSRS